MSLQGVPVQQETRHGGVSAAGGSVPGHQGKAGHPETSAEGETGPAGNQGASPGPDAGDGHGFPHIQYIQRKLSLS